MLGSGDHHDGLPVLVISSDPLRVCIRRSAMVPLITPSVFKYMMFGTG